MNPYSTSISSPPRTLVATVRRKLQSLRHSVASRLDEQRYLARHRAYVAELEQRGDLEAVSELLGTPPAQLKQCRIPPLASAELLEALLSRAGYERVEANPAVLEEVRYQCRTCARWRACRRWGQGYGYGEEYRTFCSNAETFDRFGVRKIRATGGPN